MRNQWRNEPEEGGNEPQTRIRIAPACPVLRRDRAFEAEAAGVHERAGRVRPGKNLMRQGDPADAAYLIIDGLAEVVLETPAGPIVVATIGANEIVGEMGILGNAPRAATVRARDRVIALRIAKEPFMRMVREFPNMAVSIMQELAHRVELTNNQLRTARAEIDRLGAHSGVAA